MRSVLKVKDPNKDAGGTGTQHASRRRVLCHLYSMLADWCSLSGNALRVTMSVAQSIRFVFTD